MPKLFIPAISQDSAICFILEGDEKPVSVFTPYGERAIAMFTERLFAERFMSENEINGKIYEIQSAELLVQDLTIFLEANFSHVAFDPKRDPYQTNFSPIVGLLEAINRQ